MKLKKFFASTLIGVTFLSLGAGSLTVNASAWKNGIPNFVKTSKDKAWMGTRKTYVEKNYARTILFSINGGIGESSRGFDHNGKYAPAGGSGSPILPTPYYKKTSKNTYWVKTKISQGSIKDQAKFKKYGKSMKVWLKDDGKNWRYLGIFKKVNLEYADKYEKDPLR
ncbi:hypothetical protein ACYATP_00085 [Lactobacillaceae bacterium Melli_B4]